MSNHLIIKDLVQFKLMDPKLIQIKDNFLAPSQTMTSQQPFSGKKALRVRIAATHAGIITGNNTFYMPDKMREGVPTFTQNYNKPVLVHHDENKDPIGRIVEAKYVDTSSSIRDSKWFGRDITDRGVVQGTLNDKLVKDLVDGKMPFGMAVDVVRNILDNSVLQDDPSYQGLGFAEITAEITDEEAIQKFLDGRYLTGSVSASTDKAVCSHCKQDWTQDGRCDHTPGSVVDKKKVYLIAGKFNYSEYSMVNKPADRHSKVLELYYNGVKDSVVLNNDYENRIYEVNVGFPQYELNDQEDGLMTKKDAKKVQDNSEAPNADASKTDEQKKKEAEEATAVKASETPESKTTEIKETLTYDLLFDRIFDTAYKLTEEDQDFAYQLMLDEMKAVGMTEQEINDAKLSSEKRGKLAKSTFCGPDRSFPVPDCAHVTAARRLVGRYKGTGSKDSILACVNRKAKALGCGETKDSIVEDDNRTQIMHQLLSVIETNQYQYDPNDTPVLSEEDVGGLQTLLKKLASMIGKDALAKAASAEKLGLDALTEKAFCDEISTLEEAIGNVRDEIKKISEQRDALKEEYNTLFNEMSALQDSVVEIKTSARQAKIERLALLTNLKNGVVKDQKDDSFTTLSDQAIDTQLETISSEVDMKKVVDKLNDGMSRTPSGDVTNPAQVVQDDKNTSMVTPQELEAINERYIKMSFKDKLAADRYLKSEMNRLRKENKLPKE